MFGTAVSGSARVEEYWWQGALMRILARAEDTGGAIGLVEGRFPAGFGPPLHVHAREDEAFYVLDGAIRFRQGGRDLVGGPGEWVWGPRGVPHAFRTGPGGARALILVTPGGFERMFVEGGIPAAGTEAPPAAPYDPEAARALAQRFGFDVVGPPLGD